MRILKTKAFKKWAEKEGLNDQSLLTAACEVAEGNVEANLGKKVFKKRIALIGRGKSGGSRTIIAFQEGNNLFYMFGFAKNERSTLSPKDLKSLQDAATVYLELTDAAIEKAVNARKLFEVKDDEQ